MKALLVDDHQLILTGLTDLLSQYFPDADIISCTSGAEARGLLKHELFDVMVTDLFMPGEKAFGFVSEICDAYPEMPVIVLSISEGDGYVSKCIDAGAQGFVSKSASETELTQAIETVMAGGMHTPTNYRKVKQENNTFDQDTCIAAFASLSERQREVCRLLAKGLSNKEIAFQCGLSENTVKVHVSAILRILSVDNRTQISVIAQTIDLL